MDLASLQSLAVNIQAEHALDRVLAEVVGGLCREANVALARIWLIDDGDICDACVFREECPDRSRCLHLVASDGHCCIRPEERWTRIDGVYRRFPLGVRKVGRVGATGESVLLTDLEGDTSWIREPDWAEAQGIRSFAGQPLVFRGETFGVLAVFSRDVIDDDSMTILRAFADHAAAAIANARAFEEISALRAQLELENEYLREEVKGARQFGAILGESSALQTILQQIALVAPTDSTVLIQGESGTGKELIAQAIHEHSDRAARPFVKVNCASVPRELFESEFFGHVRGAFTGAINDRVGRFQLADGGTLFLDEVGEIPLELQSKLLRVLQEGEFERLGEDRTRAVNVRVVAATNRDLRAEIEAGRFRRDLYYRLSVFPVEVPPLRERVEDIPILAGRFLEAKCREFGLPALALKQRHAVELQQYDWPGNVRELQNVIERAAITARGGDLRFDLPRPESAMPKPVEAKEPGPLRTYEEMRALERENMLRALEACNWKVAGHGGAAERLGMKPTTLASRMKAMNVARPRV